MSPVNVKLPEKQLRRLDAGIASGRAGNRSEALRIALDRLLDEWDRQAWSDAWERVIPAEEDEFADIQAMVIDRWADLDVDR